MPSNYHILLNTALRELASTKSLTSAISVCNILLEYMGIETKSVEDVELSKLKLPNAERYDRWFDAHPHFRGDRACFELTTKDSPLLEAKLYAIQKRSKLFIAGAVNFTPNFEDRDYTRNDPNMKMGIDFFFPPEKDAVIVVLSNKGSLRLVELSERLTNTQHDIFALWQDVAQVDDKSRLHTTLWESFKLSSLNKKFYEGISNSFLTLTQYLQKNWTEDQLANQFANRLHWRILFLWFLRKKGIINETKEYFTLGDQTDTEYYANTLSTLFFNVLNNEDHKEIDPITPYLNGGLFDQKSDGIYWNTHAPIFPTGFFRTLYDHFDAFNFTTDESTPEYEQIAIDPEMLGRIFESFLATLTTETGEQAKKANGAFYTPREIVSYMSSESLRQYLYTALDASTSLKSSIDDLLNRSDSDWALSGTNSIRDTVSKEDRERILKALKNVHVLDPAVWSGAFPMGVLHKILSLCERLDPAFDPYTTKLAILQENIYGVDIDPTAIEICRLRAWLSIIVDVRDVKKIKPLPNLEFKFVCANSLIGLDASKQTSLDHDLWLKQELIRIRDEYYATSSKKQKEKLQKEYLQFTHPEQGGIFDTDETRQLKSYQPFTNGVSSSFYDPELMHGVENFDIVIGNPPYIEEKGHKHIFQPVAASILWKKFYLGKMNFFFFFFHLGLELTKKWGLINFITTNYYIISAGGKKLRQDFHDRSTILQLLNFDKLKIFESAQWQNNIITLLKKWSYDDQADCLFTHQKWLATPSVLSDILEHRDEKTLYFRQNQNEIYFGPWLSIRTKVDHNSSIDFFRTENEKLKILFHSSVWIQESIDKVSKKNSSDLFQIWRWVFVLHEKEVNELNLYEHEQKIIKKYLNSENVAPYYHSHNKEYLIFSDKKNRNEIKDDKHPNIKKHLDHFSPIITSSHWPYGLHRDRSSAKNIFEQPKLICKGMFDTPEFTYDDEGYYVGFSFSIIWQKDINYSLKYLLGLMNSSLAKIWFHQNGKRRGVWVDIWVQVFREFPVPKVSAERQKPLIALVDQILSEKKLDPKADTSDLEKRIDDLVYELYGLTKEEIELVDPIRKTIEDIS